MSLVNFINEHPELSQSNELVFFGGSFNPWHEGHASCIELMPQNKTIIVIHDHNPHKDMIADHMAFNPAQDISLKLNKLKNKAYLFNKFYYENKPTPTIDWVKEMKKNFPTKNLSLLIGHDSFINIHKWTEAEKLLNSLYTLYVASRLDDENAKGIQLQKLKSINEKLHIVFLGHHPHEHLSSTNIRKL